MTSPDINELLKPCCQQPLIGPHRPGCRFEPRPDNPIDYDSCAEIEELPALTTSMTPEQFQGWLNGPGQIFIVYLPDRRSFVIKVPDEQHTFFLAMMKQLRMVLGPEVQAQSAQPVQGPAHD